MVISRRETGTGLIDDYLGKRGVAEKNFSYRSKFPIRPVDFSQHRFDSVAPGEDCRDIVHLVPLKILPLPIDLPAYDLIMLWHPRQEKSLTINGYDAKYWKSAPR